MSENNATAPRNDDDDDDESHMIGIFGGGVLQEADKLKELSESGFNTLICWSIHINDEGKRPEPVLRAKRNVFLTWSIQNKVISFTMVPLRLRKAANIPVLLNGLVC